jgi:hypothetical protein
MNAIHARNMLLPLIAALASGSLAAQTDLPGVTVTASAYTSHHGGYLVSGDFRVDPRMPYVVFPAQAMVKDDILSVEPMYLRDDDYLVVQECAVADCSVARIVRVWNATGAQTPTTNSENRIWIQHENKYFIWVKRLPDVPPTMAACISDTNCPAHFSVFALTSPPLTLIANGQLAQVYRQRLAEAEKKPPLAVVKQMHEGSTFVVTYDGGSTIRIRRMHADK